MAILNFLQSFLSNASILVRIYPRRFDGPCRPLSS